MFIAQERFCYASTVTVLVAADLPATIGVAIWVWDSYFSTVCIDSQL